jgi:hypothetical protein
MEVKSELLRVGMQVDGGTKAEPEEVGVQRVLLGNVPAGLHTGGAVGSIRGEIVAETTVGQLANQARHPCFTCLHFNNPAWMRLKSAWWQGTMQQRQTLNEIRAHLVAQGCAAFHDRHTGQDGELDVEHALNMLGVCEPLSEIKKDAIMVYPTNGCPDEVCSPTAPHGLYVPLNKDAERMGSQAFDSIMKLAASPK